MRKGSDGPVIIFSLILYFIGFYEILKGAEISFQRKFGFEPPIRIVYTLVLGVASFMTYDSYFGQVEKFTALLVFWFVLLIFLFSIQIHVVNYFKENKLRDNLPKEDYYLHNWAGFKQYFKSETFKLTTLLIVMVGGGILSFLNFLYDLVTPK